MIKSTFTRIFLLLVFFLIIKQSKASEGKPACMLNIHRVAYTAGDTIPPVSKIPEDKPAENKPVATNPAVIIKEVPKARKQIKPITLPAVPAKPIKVIKPIIKRVGSLIP